MKVIFLKDVKGKGKKSDAIKKTNDSLRLFLAENIIKGSAKKKLTTVPRTGTYTVINNRIVKAANKIAPSVSLCIFRNFTLLMKD